jgi:transposase
MSVKPFAPSEVPAETARVARAAFPKGNAYMLLRDTLGPLYADAQFTALYSERGQPATAPATLALAVVVQFAEGLSDRQVAEAIRARIDLKYLLGMQLTDAGFDYSLLSEFRDRLIAGNSSELLLDALLVRFEAHGLLHGRRQQRTDSTHVLAAVSRLNRLEMVGETMRQALNDLAVVAPDWLQAHTPADWYTRYATRTQLSRWGKSDAERQALLQQVGADGVQLLALVDDSQAPAYLREVPTVQLLRQVWEQQYECEAGQVQLRVKKKLPPFSELIISPYDPEARNRTKRDLNWNGYLAHLTETCSQHEPHILTHVVTTSSSVGDNSTIAGIHAALAAKGLAPEEHWVDTGYMSAEQLVRSRTQDGVELVGPLPPSNTWQDRSQDAFNIACFAIDWEQEMVTCPQGKQSQLWRERQREHHRQIIEVHFARADCGACPARARCTRADHRVLQFMAQPAYDALRAGRKDQKTPAFRERYKRRAGIEGTISEGVRMYGLRRTRYLGLLKTHVQHVATVCAMNLGRGAAWLAHHPQAQTRTSRFATLQVACVT